MRAPKGPATTFTLHTQCNTQRVRQQYSEFWLDGQKEYYIVKHNYKSNRFFEHKNAVRMNRVDLGAGERGYKVNTSLVDFEFGFAVKNADTGQWIYEIGGKDTPWGWKSVLNATGCIGIV